MNIFVLVKTLLRHKANERLTREQFKKRQLAHFRRFAHYVQKHSPYYAKIMKEQHIDPHTCTPEHFPVLTKHDLMKHFDSIVTNPAVTKAEISQFFRESKTATELYKNRYYAIHSSGTSGQPAFFVYSKQDWARGMAHNIRLKNVRLRRQRLAFYGMTGGHYAGVTFASTATKSVFKWLYEVKTYNVNDPIDGVIAQLNEFRPDILMGYPASVRKLAEQQEIGRLRIQPRILQVSGEVLYERDKEFMEQVFNTKVINVYSCSDHTIMGISLPEHQGMYLMEDDLIFEIEPDRLLVTNMMNFTLPLIRYEMNDILIPLGEDKINAFPFTTVRDIIGRTENAPVFRNRYGKEDTISQHMLGEMFVEHVRGLQIKVTSPETFKAFFVVEDDLEEERKEVVCHNLAHALRHMLQGKEMDNVQFDLIPIQEPIIDPLTGKYKLIL